MYMGLSVYQFIIITDFSFRICKQETYQKAAGFVWKVFFKGKCTFLFAVPFVTFVVSSYISYTQISLSILSKKDIFYFYYAGKPERAVHAISYEGQGGKCSS